MAKIEIEMDDTALWAEIMGGGWESDPVSANWIHDIEFEGGDWQTPCVAAVAHYPNGYEGQDSHLEVKSITVDDVARALGTAIAKGMHHCGEDISMDTTHWDACVSDTVLQLAVLGEYRFA